MSAISGAKFDDNTNQRTPCVLVLDASTSMNSDNKIGLLNSGIVQFAQDLRDDSVAKGRVQICVIKVTDTAEVIVPWCDAEQFSPPTLEADGLTALGEGVQLGLDLIETQKAEYRNYGIPYTRPWLFIITDGEPTDDNWQQAAANARTAEAAKKVLVWPFCVEGADIDVLRQFSSINKPFLIKDKKFKEFFRWLSASTTAASQSAPGTQVQLPSNPFLVTV